MEEESLRGAIIENRSLRRNHWKEDHREETIEERGIWEESGRHPGGIWGHLEASGMHLGRIWEASWKRPGAEGGQARPGECRRRL